MTNPQVRPVLLMDVDGVLAPFGSPLRPAGFDPVRFGAEELDLNPDHGRWLRTLETVYDPWWCTARFDDVCDTVAHALNAGTRWPVVDFAGTAWREPSGRHAVVRPVDVRSWKLPTVARLASTVWDARRIVWVDDDLLGADVVEWAKRRTARVAPTVLVRVEPSRGLTDEHLRTLLGDTLLKVVMP